MATTINLIQAQPGYPDVPGSGFVDSTGRVFMVADGSGNPHPQLLSALDTRYGLGVLPAVALPTLTALPSTTVATLTKGILNNANKYALNTWLPATYPTAGAIVSLKGVGEQQIRTPAAAALGLAAALATGTYDPAVTGVDAPTARTWCHRLTSALIGLHRANGGTWGGDPGGPPAADFGSNSWQSALWAMLTGTAAWLTWADLTPAEQQGVQRLVIWEADRMTSWHLPYWRNTAGVQNSIGDSKSEEVAWDASVVVLAIAMMPTHPNAAAWTTKLIEMGIAYSARPVDLTSTTLLHGMTPPDVLEGSNVQADGTVVNHGIIHPAYTISASQTLWASFFALAATGRDAPRCLGTGAPAMYASLSTVSYSTANGYQAPGGTIYTPGSGAIYYPQGNDYGTNQAPINMAAADVQAAKFGWDTGLATTATAWAQLHLQYVADMQARFTTGKTYIDLTEDDYPAAEQWIANTSAAALLTLCTPAVRWSNAPSATITQRNRGV